MKNLLFVLMAFVLVASCAMQAPVETGSITLAGPRALNIPRDADSVVIRYVLTRDGEIIPLNEQPALILENNELREVTINNLLPGAGYQLALSVGTKATPLSVLQIATYGSSQTFSIAADSNTEVAIALKLAPGFDYLTISGAPASATVIGPTVYVLDGNTLKKYVDGTEILPSTTLVLPTGVTVNSISTGKYFNGTTIVDELWLNTSKGIYRSSAGSYVSNLNAGLTPNVTMSGAVVLDSHIFGIYTGGSTVIGFVDADVQADFATEWYTLDDAIVEFPDQSGIISGISTDIIKSIAVNEDNDVKLYYAVTALGTVMGSQGLKTVTDDPGFSADPLTSINPYMMTVADGSSIEVISSAGNRVFVGTATGLYTDTVRTVSATGEIPGKPETGLNTPVTGTANISFTALASYKKGTVVYTAAVTEDNDVIILKDGAFDDDDTLDAASGVPENARPVFHLQGDHLYLLLTGTNGAVDYDTGF